MHTAYFLRLLLLLLLCMSIRCTCNEHNTTYVSPKLTSWGSWRQVDEVLAEQVCSTHGRAAWLEEPGQVGGGVCEVHVCLPRAVQLQAQRLLRTRPLQGLYLPRQLWPQCRLVAAVR